MHRQTAAPTVVVVAQVLADTTACVSVALDPSDLTSRLNQMLVNVFAERQFALVANVAVFVSAGTSVVAVGVTLADAAPDLVSAATGSATVVTADTVTDIDAVIENVLVATVTAVAELVITCAAAEAKVRVGVVVAPVVDWLDCSVSLG